MMSSGWKIRRIALICLYISSTCAINEKLSSLYTDQHLNIKYTDAKESAIFLSDSAKYPIYTQTLQQGKNPNLKKLKIQVYMTLVKFYILICTQVLVFSII